MKTGAPNLLVWMAVVVISTHLSAAAAKDVPVITFITGTGAGDLTHTIQNDGFGEYRHTAKGTTGVESHIQAGGDYEIDLYYFTTNRKLSFDFSHPVSAITISGAPDGFVTLPARLITKCASTSHNLLTMTATDSPLECPLAGRFDWNGRVFLTRMNPINYPGSTYPSISCEGNDASGKCNQWKMTACSANVDGTAACAAESVMTLMEEKTAKGKVSEVKVGDYYMNFELRFVK